MQAKLRQRGEITVVEISGKLDMERSEEFRNACLRNLQGRKVVFALGGLQFVGSSGIQVFFRMIQDFGVSSAGGVKIAGLPQDFHRLLQHTTPTGFELHPTLEQALNQFAFPAVSN